MSTENLGHGVYEKHETVNKPISPLEPINPLSQKIYASESSMKLCVWVKSLGFLRDPLFFGAFMLTPFKLAFKDILQMVRSEKTSHGFLFNTGIPIT